MHHSSGAVSPTPREIASSTAVMSPGSAVGMMTRRATTPLRAPSASPASRTVSGTLRSDASDAFMMIGTMRTAIATAPASPEKPIAGNVMPHFSPPMTMIV